jgi:hypothetical protein
MNNYMFEVVVLLRFVGLTLGSRVHNIWHSIPISSETTSAAFRTTSIMRSTAALLSLLPYLTAASDPVAATVRQQWMLTAKSALDSLAGSPCPFAAFGAAIVNHTASQEGELVCIGANSVRRDGNPTLHGEYQFDLQVKELGR